MEATLGSIASNPLVTLASFALAIFGIIIAVIFYFRSQKNKTPCFEKKSNTIIEGLHKSLDGLQVQYKGTVQERITVTKVVFWNDGKETIDRADLVEMDPLRIEVPNSIDVLDIQVINTSSDSNSVAIGEVISTENVITYPMSFEYLDQDEYFVVQIIHNGASQEQFEIQGKIKGVKSLEKITGARVQSSLIGVLPFVGQINPLVASPLFMKYFGSLTYLSMGLFAIWNLFNGKTDWYVWVGAGICFFAAGIMFYGFRHIAPVKI